MHPSYISKLAELIRKTPKRVQVKFSQKAGILLSLFLKKLSLVELFTQANYLVGRAVKESTSLLTKV